MSDHRLRVVTLNCWGLKYVSKHRKERIAAIADVLASSDYDVVILQEIWVYSDYEYVRSAVSKNIPYSKFFYSGALGAGLAIFSRFPIIGATIHPYSLNGSPIEVIQGDWFVGKAAASVLLSHPILGQVQIFNTHLFAPGGDSGPSHLQAHRLVNAWEFAKLVRQAAEAGRYVIAAGDFNSTPSSLPMTIIRDHAAVKDAWVASHPNTPPTMQPSPRDAVHDHGITADSPLNSFSVGKRLEPIARKFHGKRLDYILYRQPSNNNGKAPTLKCMDTRVVFTELVPGRDFSFSDHFGVEATFEITPVNDDSQDDSPDPPSPYANHSADSSAPSVVLIATANPSSIPADALSTDSITEVLHSLMACYRFSIYRARSQLTVFGVCIMLLLVILVGSPWLPPSWLNTFVIFLTIFLAWLATTFLYVGFVYGRWEVNALTNVIEELEIYRNSLLDQQSRLQANARG
ncbi:inositol phosphophingolipids phospholipase C [Laetiporus sulphureus 93-53]|uniref:Inositol phosphophingolipids phospholipase C n=1 Tax=Laetiporus sulphureus 93-53 TaxID=1314785 RepID=A0A165F9S5_9APHY|nr:inositol phosphophingolipids phospholipase C [Laetiporus sulphureus 93-53]KZT08647.1 inositol phosphophingolipids phospholipase C [Laetiporus sulphureus 93-53]